MIVNVAYPFMGEKGPAVNPNIWGNGVVNYPYTFSGSGATWDKYYNRFTLHSPNDVTFTLPLKTFTKIQFNVATSDGSGVIRIYVKGDTTTLQTFNVGTSAQNIEYNIPPKYRTDNVEIVLHAYRYTTYAYAGVMVK